ncbi:prion-like-(Q/N-rich) domain-bearing protein 25 isoform X2 [Microplitis demolitor]|uniref:prion-like-(Q/N-rich) domain-bearing protein 25 isoform X2 n=1 Tax=Microplitis demolitor TaxID=69319 RepID=UPI0004CD9035|nr:prion-like-(Q/N-rich) domain-bearing protein 25 isoform X2 [Microplitis demolitor]
MIRKPSVFIYYIISLGLMTSYIFARDHCIFHFSECDPDSKQSCCEPYQCVLDQTEFVQRGISRFICAKNANAKCSENNTCVCQFGSYEYNDTICLHKKVYGALKSEFNVYYRSATYGRFRLKENFTSESGLHRESKTKWGDPCTMCITNPNGLLCNIENRVVLDSTFYFPECACPNRTKFNASSLSCEQPEFNDCSSNKDCSDLDYASCSGGKCSCLQNYQPVNGRCLGNLGAKCNHDIDCRVFNAICQSSRCQCEYGYYETYGLCRKYAEKVEGDCRTNKTCELLDHTSCSISNKCRCLPSYINVNGTCRKHIHMKNSAEPELTVKKHTCQADHYYENGHCHAYAKRLNDHCASEKACERLTLTSCLNGRCNCSKFNIMCKVLNVWSYFV